MREAITQYVEREEARASFRREARAYSAEYQETGLRAAQAIARQFALLEADPEIGRPVSELPEMRELAIGFGDSGYVALHRHGPDAGRRVCAGVPAQEGGRMPSDPAARKARGQYRRCQTHAVDASRGTLAGARCALRSPGEARTPVPSCVTMR
jgi:hypothetical protein